MAKFLVVLLAFFTVQFALSESFNFRWCTINAQEKAKCDEFIKYVNMTATNKGLTVTAGCVQGNSTDDCIAKIKANTADLCTLDGGHLYAAGKDSGLVPIVAEAYGSLGVKYYAVAVVKKNNTGFMLGESLKGKKSCHTGVRRTAGWNVPVGYLLRMKIIPGAACGNPLNDLISVGKFFKESCAPGASDAKYNSTGEVPGNLCSLCAGTGADKCSTDVSKNAYVGYHGSFKCMAKGGGDVAFVKHTTVSELVAMGGYGSVSDYEYLCKDGTRKAIGDYATCSLGSNPAHAVVTRPDNANINDIVTILTAMGDMYGAKQTNYSMFQLFNSTKFGGGNLLFKDSTTELKNIADKTYTGYLGEDYIKDTEALKSCVTTTTTKPSPTSKSDTAVPSVLLFVAMAMFALLRL